MLAPTQRTLGAAPVLSAPRSALRTPHGLKYDIWGGGGGLHPPHQLFSLRSQLLLWGSQSAGSCHSNASKNVCMRRGCPMELTANPAVDEVRKTPCMKNHNPRSRFCLCQPLRRSQPTGVEQDTDKPRLSPQPTGHEDNESCAKTCPVHQTIGRKLAGALQP